MRASNILDEQRLEYERALLEDMRREAREAEEARVAAEREAVEARLAEEARAELEAIERQRREDAALHLSPRSLRVQRLRVFEERVGAEEELRSAPARAPTQCVGVTKRGKRCLRVVRFRDGLCASHRPSAPYAK